MDMTLRDIVGAANALSAAAGLVMGRISRTPAAIIRGLPGKKRKAIS